KGRSRQDRDDRQVLAVQVFRCDRQCARLRNKGGVKSLFAFARWPLSGVADQDLRTDVIHSCGPGEGHRNAEFLLTNIDRLVDAGLATGAKSVDVSASDQARSSA